MSNEWLLPPPPKGKEKKYLPLVKISRTIPFGYERDSEDDDILIPIPHELEALEKARLLIKEYSYREVADWLTHQTGRAISHEGLRKRFKIESKRKREASIARFYAERYKEAKEKAEKLEARIGGRMFDGDGESSDS